MYKFFMNVLQWSLIVMVILTAIYILWSGIHAAGW